MGFKMKKILLAVMLITLPHLAYGAIINVPADQPTIQAGINAALEGDTVLVAPDIYSGEGNREISTLGKSIVVKSTDGPEVTILDCEGYNGIVNIETGEDESTVIEGFTITNALNGIYLYNSHIKMVDLIITANLENGIYYPFLEDKGNTHDRSNLYIVDSRISLNGQFGIANETGGLGFLTMRGCTIDSNQVAGLNVTNIELDIKHCEFIDNPTAIYLHGNSDVAGIDSCLFDGNQTALSGESHVAFTVSNSIIKNGQNGILGGTWYADDRVWNSTFENLTGKVFGGSVDAKNCIVNNCGAIASSFGMGIDVGTLNFDSCQFLNNAGGINGGSVGLTIKNSTYIGNSGDISFNEPYAYIIIENSLFETNFMTISNNYYGYVQATNSTFVSNRNTLFICHGYEDNDNSYIGISNCIIAYNINAALVALDESSVINVECSNVYNNGGGNYVDMPDQTGINGNISENPLFCNPFNGDYSISTSSPCNAPNNSCGELMGAYGPACDRPGVWHVYADGSGDAPTIQAAINSSMDYDTVLIHPGTYSGEGNNNLQTYGKLIVVKGSGGADSTIIDCEGYRGFSMDDSNEDSNTVIDGLCFTNALSGINLLWATPRLKNLKFYHNIGGGITNYYDDNYKEDELTSASNPLVITNCEFIGNDSGGVYFATWVFPEIIIEDCVFDSNALVGLDCGGVIKRCTFTNNGAAIDCRDYFPSFYATTMVDSCYFENNSTAIIGQVTLNKFHYTKLRPGYHRRKLCYTR